MLSSRYFIAYMDGTYATLATQATYIFLLFFLPVSAKMCIFAPEFGLKACR